MSSKIAENQPYTGPERRRHRTRRGCLTVGEHAFEIVDRRYNFIRPSDAEFEQARFTGGDAVKKAVRALFDRLEGQLDAEKVARLQEAFDRGVDIWEQAGLFTPERATAGYKKPVFARDYQPLLTQGILDMTEPGEELNRGYGTPVFAPMDVPLHSVDPAKLSYFKLLKDVLLRAFHGTAGGKQPNTLLIGPERRVLTAEQVDLHNILGRGELYLKPGVVHDVKKLDPKKHGGVSEEELLARLDGNERRTGGVMRLERNGLIMPSDVGEESMSVLAWGKKLPAILPPNADAQNMKQAIAYVIYCLETQGWIPDYYDYDRPATSRINLAVKSFVPDQGFRGAVPALCWYVYHRQFGVDGDDAGYRYSVRGVLAGVRMKEA